MENSILEESKKAKSKRLIGVFANKKIYIGIAVVLVLITSIYIFVKQGSDSDIKEVEIKEWTVKQDDIKIALSTDGQVVAEDGVELSFSVSGDTLEVSDVFVKEGELVEKGDKIASVKTESLTFELRSAYNSYKSALDKLNQAKAEPTEEEKQKYLNAIASAEISLTQSEVSLNKTIADNEKNLDSAEDSLKTSISDLKYNQDTDESEFIEDTYDDLINTLRPVSITYENSFIDADEILGINNKYANDDYEDLLGVKDPQAVNDSRLYFSLVETSQDQLSDDMLTINTASYDEIDDILDRTEIALGNMSDFLYAMSLMLNATITSGDLSTSELSVLKSTISSARTSNNSSISSLTNAHQAISSSYDSLDDLQMDYDNAVDALAYAIQEADRDLINAQTSYELKQLTLVNAQADYKELITPPTTLDLSSYRSSVTSAGISLDKANYNLSKATITSPIDGEVALLNYKQGDIIFSSDNESMASIINDKTLYIEVNIEEADISTVKVGQKSDIVIDAIDGLELQGEISFVSKTSSTNNNGVVTYLVRVIFENTEQNEIREGMTAFVDFVTASAEDVLIIPVSAVRNVGGNPSVQVESGEWQNVLTGFTDGKYVEVLTGLEIGDKILY